ncbi:hypothetical protein B2J93_618 [Marssonina coronariae]|uniref:Uncharacterized protein n=1 Tax=Diplocarpon coronariae TaxID=2795749 RepID=A0A218ZAL9_9HELO|nr:hypothetical protein B2J93_618 [Marssonina coronariae]
MSYYNYGHGTLLLAPQKSMPCRPMPCHTHPPIGPSPSTILIKPPPPSAPHQLVRYPAAPSTSPAALPLDHRPPAAGFSHARRRFQKVALRWSRASTLILQPQPEPGPRLRSHSDSIREQEEASRCGEAPAAAFRIRAPTTGSLDRMGHLSSDHFPRSEGLIASEREGEVEEGRRRRGGGGGEEEEDEDEEEEQEESKDPERGIAETRACQQAQALLGSWYQHDPSRPGSSLDVRLSRNDNRDSGKKSSGKHNGKST